MSSEDLIQLSFWYIPNYNAERGFLFIIICD